MYQDIDRQSLLAGEHDHAGAEAARDADEDDNNSDSNNGQRLWWRPLALMFLFTLVSDVGYFMSIAPQTRLFEDLVCRKYYAGRSTTLFLHAPDGRPDEALCKIPAVQDVVAELFGMQIFFDGIVGVLFGIYFGVLADRIGRRAILTISAIGVLLSSAWTLFICEFVLRYWATLYFQSLFLLQ
jgi:MFS family permease